MAHQKKSVLLVEGEGDVDFFEALLRKLQWLSQIEITPPKNYGLKTNTVSHFPKLINLLIKRLQKGEIQQVGIIADADYVSGGGFQQRWNTLTGQLADNGYRIPANPPKLPYTGSLFQHNDGLPAIGLWLMPDHQNNGMLEDLIKQSISEKKQHQLLNTVHTCLKKLPFTLFSDYHQTKAIIYTWLAWQKRPGQTLDVVINGNLINWESPEIQGLIKWLTKVFEERK